MIYAELLGIIIRMLARHIVVNQSVKMVGSALRDETTLASSYVLRSELERQTALQTLRLATASQFNYFNQVQPEGAVSEAQLQSSLLAVENQFNRKKSVSTVDAYVSNWMTSVVDIYMSELSPSWLKSLHSITSIDFNDKPHLYDLIAEYSGPYLSIQTFPKVWDHIDPEERSSYQAAVSFSRIKTLITEDDMFKDYLREMASKGHPASSYLPYKMLSEWTKFNESVAVKLGYLDSHYKIGVNPLTPLSLASSYPIKHMMPVAESKCDWESIINGPVKRK